MSYYKPQVIKYKGQTANSHRNAVSYQDIKDTIRPSDVDAVLVNENSVFFIEVKQRGASVNSKDGQRFLYINLATAARKAGMHAVSVYVEHDNGNGTVDLSDTTVVSVYCHVTKQYKPINKQFDKWINRIKYEVRKSIDFSDMVLLDIQGVIERVGKDFVFLATEMSGDRKDALEYLSSTLESVSNSSIIIYYTLDSFNGSEYEAFTCTATSVFEKNIEEKFVVKEQVIRKLLRANEKFLKKFI